MASKGKPYKTVIYQDFAIWIGRSDERNDILTFSVANTNDLWLHVDGFHGSHVVIPTDGRVVPATVIRRAAELAAWHSKARQETTVPVHYCWVSQVSKPEGFEAGKVQITGGLTITVTPRKEATDA